MCKNNVKLLILETKKQGITRVANLSGLKRRTVEQWIYDRVMPSFANAIKWANGLGLEFNMSKAETFAEMKRFGLINSAEASEIKIRTIRGWIYSSVEPPLDKIEQIMTAIGKPLELIPKGGKYVNYNAVFKLGNGIMGEMKLNAKSDSEAVLAVCQMFVSFKPVEWKIDKMESIFKPQEALNKALDYIELADDKIDSLIDYERVEKSRLPEEKTDSEEWERYVDNIYQLNEVKENFEYAKEHLKEVLKQIK